MNKPWLLGGALLLSLAANAFLGGLLLGKPAHMTGFSRMQGDPAGPRLKHMMQRMQQLPPDQRKQVREKMLEFAPQMQELAKAIRAQHEVIEDLIQAPQLQGEQLQGAFAKQRELQGKMQEMSQQMLIDVASTLPPEQRKQLLKPPPR